MGQNSCRCLDSKSYEVNLRKRKNKDTNQSTIEQSTLIAITNKDKILGLMSVMSDEHSRSTYSNPKEQQQLMNKGIVLSSIIKEQEEREEREKQQVKVLDIRETEEGKPRLTSITEMNEYDGM